ncbi:MAG: nitrile hydratase subunit alpha [Rhodospirillaceae bacterium]|nr:nitrile hydratase subunit alpha [Rhodospirillaceae bacterium]
MSGHHPHPGQPDSEDQPWSHEQLMAAAVEALLVQKGVITPADVASALDYWASRTPADGARLVARCWTDDAFASRTMENVNEAAAELGLDIGSTRVVAVANGPALHNVLVCTLCSCYPIGLLGDSPGWYKSRAYRSRVVREPRAVLAEFGVQIPDGVEVRVHDSTADLRYIVIPMRPEGTEHLTELELAGLVTRDCMIGTALPRYGAA